MRNENICSVGRVPVVPRSDPGGVCICLCEGSPFVDKEADERANSYVGFFQGEESINLRARGSGN